ncbi:hypothetical protein QJS66_01175 [Kocuria rhizophila]|nr:hypothetical protein QJS66_01175 [Kocuria rhizophila]
MALTRADRGHGRPHGARDPATRRGTPAGSPGGGRPCPVTCSWQLGGAPPPRAEDHAVLVSNGSELLQLAAPRAPRPTRPTQARAVWTVVPRTTWTPSCCASSTPCPLHRDAHLVALPRLGWRRETAAVWPLSGSAATDSLLGGDG